MCVGLKEPEKSPCFPVSRTDERESVPEGPECRSFQQLSSNSLSLAEGQSNQLLDHLVVRRAPCAGRACGQLWSRGLGRNPGLAVCPLGGLGQSLSLSLSLTCCKMGIIIISTCRLYAIHVHEAPRTAPGPARACENEAVEPAAGGGSRGQRGSRTG